MSEKRCVRAENFGAKLRESTGPQQSSRGSNRQGRYALG